MSYSRYIRNMLDAASLGKPGPAIRLGRTPPQLCNLSRIKRTNRATKQQKQLRRFRQLLNRADGAIKTGAGHDRPVVGQQHGAVSASVPTHDLSRTRIARPETRQQWQSANLHYAICRDRRNAGLAVEPVHAGHRGGIGRMQVRDCARPCARRVHCPMQDRFLRRQGRPRCAAHRDRASRVARAQDGQVKRWSE